MRLKSPASKWNRRCSAVIGVDDVPRLKREAARPIALFAGASAAQALFEPG
jgi:hypothetical protein